MIYLIPFFIASVFCPISKCMEHSISLHENNLSLIDLPIDSWPIILKEIVKLDATTYKKNKNEAKLNNLIEKRLSFSQSIQNFLKAYPPIIEIISHINQIHSSFFFNLRNYFFIKANICPSGKFIDELLKKFNQNDPKKLHNIFYALISSNNFTFQDPKEWEKAPIQKVPFGYNLLIIKHHIQYNNARINLPNENPYFHIAAILCDPYLHIQTKHNLIDDYLSNIDFHREQKIELLKKTNQLRKKIKKRGSIENSVHCIIHYLLQNHPCPYWAEKKDKTLLYYYFKKNMDGFGQNYSHVNTFLKNEIEKLLAPKDEYIDPGTFRDSRNLLLSSFKNETQKEAALIKAIFQEHSATDVLRVFTYFKTYWNSINNYMKALEDTDAIFYAQHFNNLVKYAPEFDTIYKKDINAFVSFLETKLKKKNRYYPTKQSKK